MSGMGGYLMTNALGSPSKIALVTDSTSGLPPAWLRRFGVTVVPLDVIAQDQSYIDGVQISPEQILNLLRRKVVVTTSRPAPGRFLAAFDQLEANGTTDIVCVHLSSLLSGTCEAAHLASLDVGARVKVIDSGLLGAGVAATLLAGGLSRRLGNSPDQVVRVMADAAARTTVTAYVDSLDYLRRGGRIRASQALLGTALGRRPLMQTQDGQLHVVETVRGGSRGLHRLAECAARSVPGAVTGDKIVDVAVQHVGSNVAAHQVMAHLLRILPAVGRSWIAPVGAVLAAHGGPGALAVTITPTA